MTSRAMNVRCNGDGEVKPVRQSQTEDQDTNWTDKRSDGTTNRGSETFSGNQSQSHTPQMYLNHYAHESTGSLTVRFGIPVPSFEVVCYKYKLYEPGWWTTFMNFINGTKYRPISKFCSRKSPFFASHLKPGQKQLIPPALHGDPLARNP